MTLKIVNIRPVVSKEAEQVARDLLARVLSGEVREISVAAVNNDGTIMTSFTTTDDQIRQIAAVSRLLHRLHVNADAYAEAEDFQTPEDDE